MDTHCIVANKYKSALEEGYAKQLELLHLGGEIQWWRYEGIRLHLGGGAWYKPDFVYLDNKGQIHIHETKGHWMEAARVRIKVASELYPMFRFVAVKRKNRQFEYEEF